MNDLSLVLRFGKPTSFVYFSILTDEGSTQGRTFATKKPPPIKGAVTKRGHERPI